jgi:adenylate cyclase
VGIDSGDVVVGSIGSEDHLKVSVVGDVVVTAQRLEGTAAVAHDFAKDPCRILISDRTRKLVGDRFAVEPAGTVALKGHADGVSVYRVLGASGAL